MEELGAVRKQEAATVHETERKDETRMRDDTRATQPIMSAPDVAAPAPASVLAPVPTDAAAPVPAPQDASKTDAASLSALSDVNAALKLENEMMKNMLLARGEAPIEALPLAEARKRLAGACARYQGGDQARVPRARAPPSSTQSAN